MLPHIYIFISHHHASSLHKVSLCSNSFVPSPPCNNGLPFEQLASSSIYLRHSSAPRSPECSHPTSLTDTQRSKLPSAHWPHCSNNAKLYCKWQRGNVRAYAVWGVVRNDSHFGKGDDKFPHIIAARRCALGRIKVCELIDMRACVSIADAVVFIQISSIMVAPQWSGIYSASHQFGMAP